MVLKLIRLLPLKHPEKVLWKNKREEIEKRKVVFWSEIEKEVKKIFDNVLISKEVEKETAIETKKFGYLDTFKIEKSIKEDTKIVSKKSYYVLEIKRNKDVLNLLRILELKHKEKIARKDEAIEFLTKKNIINNYYFSLLYNRLSSLTRPKSVKEFAIINNLNYFTALSYLLHNRKREFIKKTQGKYIISKKGKDFINLYENALKSSSLHHS